MLISLKTMQVYWTEQNHPSVKNTKEYTLEMARINKCKEKMIKTVYSEYIDNAHTIIRH